MPFVALVMNLKPEAADRSLEEELAIDATAASWLLPEMLAILNRDLRVALQHSLERGLLTLAIIKQGRGAWSLRVTALGEEGLLSLSVLLQAFAICPVLHLRQRRWVVEVADLARSRWAGTSSWADFLGKPTGHMLRFHLGTPLVVPSLREASGHRAFYFPQPLPIFAELERRWRDLGGPSLPSDMLSLCERGGCVVADYRLRSSPIALPERDCPGFLGWVAYECRSASTDCVAALTALARFAFFSGVGHYTSCGMGATRVLIGP
jgi:CRISPR-associated endoribonuclease Cas6